MKKLLFYILAGTVLFASCDALNQNPSTSVTTETAITTVEDLANAVTGVYWMVTYGNMMTMGSEMAIYADLIGSDSYQPASSGQNASRLATYTMTPADTYLPYFYTYSALANVNNALEKGAALEDQEGAAPYIAELYGLRGLFHFHLATFYAPIPTSGSDNKMGIVLSDKVFPIEYIGERASLEATYKQITDDLTVAVESGLNKDKYTGHLNYWAALALRARAYLYWGKYDEALADCKEIIKDSPYALYTTENYEAAWSQEGTDEMIMEYIQTDNYNAQRYAPGYYTSPTGYSEYGVSKDFYDWIKTDANDVRSKLVYECVPTADNENAGYYPGKYPGKTGSSTPEYTNNIKVIRLSEVYLIAAEAALKGTTPNAATAAGYINTLRTNRITGYDATAVTSVTVDDILDERRKELFAEGHMAFDAWRNGKSIVKGAEAIGPKSIKTVLPLPKEEIELSGGKLLQNPGYGN